MIMSAAFNIRLFLQIQMAAEDFNVITFKKVDHEREAEKEYVEAEGVHRKGDKR